MLFVKRSPTDGEIMRPTMRRVSGRPSGSSIVTVCPMCRCSLWSVWLASTISFAARGAWPSSSGGYTDPFSGSKASNMSTTLPSITAVPWLAPARMAIAEYAPTKRLCARSVAVMRLLVGHGVGIADQDVPVPPLLARAVEQVLETRPEGQGGGEGSHRHNGAEHGSDDWDRTAPANQPEAHTDARHQRHWRSGEVLGRA